jgi:hypothetical protein
MSFIPVLSLVPSQKESLKVPPFDNTLTNSTAPLVASSTSIAGTVGLPPELHEERSKKLHKTGTHVHHDRRHLLLCRYAIILSFQHASKLTPWRCEYGFRAYKPTADSCLYLQDLPSRARMCAPHWPLWAKSSHFLCGFKQLVSQ